MTAERRGWDPDRPSPELDRQAMLIAGALLAADRPLRLHEIVEATGLSDRKVRTIIERRPAPRLSGRFARVRLATRGRPYAWWFSDRPDARAGAELYAATAPDYLMRTRGLTEHEAQVNAAYVRAVVPGGGLR